MGDDSLLTNLFKSVDEKSREQDLDGDSNMIFITLLGETEANSLRLHDSGSSSVITYPTGYDVILSMSE